MYTFEALSAMPRSQLEEIRKYVLEDLANAQRERWELIGQIMYFQHAAAEARGQTSGSQQGKDDG